VSHDPSEITLIFMMIISVENSYLQEVTGSHFYPLPLQSTTTLWAGRGD